MEQIKRNLENNTKQISHISMITAIQWVDQYKNLLKRKKNNHIQQNNSTSISHLIRDYCERYTVDNPTD